jgi:type II secretory pathway pseudopilin PulG
MEDRRMNTPLCHQPANGFSLIETIVSVGVLALAIPLVLGALVESGDSSNSAAAETRAGWIVPACLNELKAAAEGKSLLIPPIPYGERFPAAGQVYGIAFSAAGQSLGPIDKPTYESGLREINGQDVRYITKIEGEVLAAKPGSAPMRSVLVTIEYPAVAPAGKRTKLEFNTKTP